MMIEDPKKQNVKKPNDGQDTVQRIQVGVVGLVAVLMVVSVANFVLQRASDEQSAIEEIQAEALENAGRLAVEAEPAPAPAPAEPLAELGITAAPVPEDEVVQPVPTVPGTRAQVVPDLEPDPKLEARMDKER
ncbi:hypothetical protein [Parasphingorhabdus cellanae]|uniref:Energy transducer TonB n=1 Tax=Parasphingorhabdus cellanae TaxID=2806553 RepID=A0ABX7T322_9SPHN|nr:hypothetical protein [Parasphingorhabdus cellanae]QTD55556.1 hypothetical protein J4G78_15335 [Parasphingorhabdus cellanae]